MSRKKTIPDILFIFFIILFAISISMYIDFYGSSGLYNNPAETVLEVVTGTTYEVSAETIYEHVSESIYELKAENDVNIITNTANDIFDINKADTDKISSIFFDATIPSSFCLLSVLFIVFNIFYSTSFIFLPDDWTLVNQKVRLDD